MRPALMRVDESSETLDRLSGSWRIYQLRQGHRWSTDDALTAWLALQQRPDARALLDLGAGVGSVGLLVLRELDADAVLTSVEVQAVSAGLLRKTVTFNGLQHRVRVIEGDLREVPLPKGAFDLIVANPPYLVPDRARVSPHPQRAAARVELHGNIFDYCRAAACALAERGGRFCFCFSASDPRPDQAIAAAGLQLHARYPVRFRDGRAPTIALFCCGWSVCDYEQGAEAPPLVVRGDDGAWTEQYLQIRRRLGIDPP